MINKFIKSIMFFGVSVFLLITRPLREKLRTNSNKIVIITLHKLGDSVFTIPAINSIISFYKNNITIVCFPETKEIYSLIFNEITFITIEHNHFYFRKLVANKHARKILKNIRPDTIYDLTANINSVSLLFNIRARKIIGTNKQVYKNLYTTFVPLRSEPHITDIYIDVIKSHIPSISIDGLVPNNFSETNGPLLIHPFAGWKAKEWSLRKFIVLAEILNRDYNTVMIFPSGRIDSDIKDQLNILKVKFIETNSITELIHHIKRCSVFIGNDSGPAYIANLLRKPVFIIYGPTNPIYHIPLIGSFEYEMSQIKCSPIFNKKVCFTNGGRDGCPSHECMIGLESERVVNKLYKFLEFCTIKTNF